MEFRPLSGRAWMNRGAMILRTLFLVAVVGLALYQSYDSRKLSARRSPLQGVWEVEEFSLDGEPRPPLVTDEARWRRVIFDYPRVLAVQSMGDRRQRYWLELDAGQRTLSLTKREDPGWKTVFTYEQPEAERLTIAGDLEGHAVRADLRRTDPSKFLLTSRGFHWVNDFPFNR